MEIITPEMYALRDIASMILPGDCYIGLFASARVKRPNRKQLFNAKRRSILARKSS